MSLDILSRLEDPDLLFKDEEFVLVPLCTEAADEIRTLRAALTDLWNAANLVGDKLHVVQPFFAVARKHAAVLSTLDAPQNPLPAIT